MLIIQFLLHSLFSECSFRITCFALKHLSQQRSERCKGGMRENRAADILFGFLKRNQGVTSAVASILGFMAACTQLLHRQSWEDYWQKSAASDPVSKDIFLTAVRLP